jgi:hypothetical protein
MDSRSSRGIAALALGLGLTLTPSGSAQGVFGLDAPPAQPGTDLFQSPALRPVRSALQGAEDLSGRAGVAAIDSSVAAGVDHAMIFPDAALTQARGDLRVLRGLNDPKPLGRHATDTAFGLVQSRTDAVGAGLGRMASSHWNTQNALLYGGIAGGSAVVQHPARLTRAGLDAGSAWNHGNMRAGREVFRGAQGSLGELNQGFGRAVDSVNEDKPLWRHGTDLATEAWRTQNRVVGQGATSLWRAGTEKVRGDWNALRTGIGSYFKPW